MTHLHVIQSIYIHNARKVLHFSLISLSMGLIPLDTFVKRYSGAAKDIESTPNCQVHPALTTDMDPLQIL